MRIKITPLISISKKTSFSDEEVDLTSVAILLRGIKEGDPCSLLQIAQMSLIEPYGINSRQLRSHLDIACCIALRGMDLL